MTSDAADFQSEVQPNARLARSLSLLEKVAASLPQTRQGFDAISYHRLALAAFFESAEGRGDLFRRLLIDEYNRLVWPRKLRIARQRKLPAKPKKMSVTRLASRMNMSRAWVSSLLNGGHSMTWKAATALCDATCDWLVSTPASWMLLEAVFPVDSSMCDDTNPDCLHALLDLMQETETKSETKEEEKSE